MQTNGHSHPVDEIEAGAESKIWIEEACTSGMCSYIHSY